MDFTPYTWSTTPLYGHYALFYLMPLKIMGVSAFSIAICLAATVVIEQVAFLYLIDSFPTDKELD